MAFLNCFKLLKKIKRITAKLFFLSWQSLIIIPVLPLFLIYPGSTDQVFGQDFRPTIEYQIKASLIFNFLQFISWPPDAGDPSQQTLKICLVGPDRFGIALSALEQELVQGKHIATSYLIEPTEDNLTSCQVIFLSLGSSISAEQIISTVGNKNVLTIGESSDFLNKGGIINLLTDNNKIVFDINRRAALQARLTISSKLLRVARSIIE